MTPYFDPDFRPLKGAPHDGVWLSILGRVNETLAPGAEVHAEDVRPLVAKVRRDLLVEVAVAWLVRELRGSRRERVLAAERSAQSAGRRRPPPGTRHGSFNKRNGGVADHCACDVCARARQEEADADAEFMDRTAKLVHDFANSLRMEWEQELLDSGFALPDGQVVLWGDATVEDHRRRVSMLTRNAAANMESAARHERAIADITAVGGSTLRDVVHRSAAAS